MKEMKYIGQCDRLRKAPGGELSWKAMMKAKKPISLKELKNSVDVDAILDEDESIEEFIADNPEAQAFESIWDNLPAKFLQRAGFEFIWVEDEGMKFASEDDAIQFLSNFTGQRIFVASKYNVVWWDEDAEDYDPWVAADQADAVMKKTGIRPNRSKNLTFIALDEKDEVIGAAFTETTNTEDYGFEYSFDLAVLPEHRGSVGMELIRACIDEAKSLPDNIIRLWVINPKLVRVLERKFDFEIEQQYSDGSAHMVKN